MRAQAGRGVKREGAQARLLRLGMETHVSLPLFTGMLVVAIWLVTFHFIEAERATAHAAALDSVAEIADTYEAQMARNLGGIDQTLKVIKYAVERKGALGALPELHEHGLLPSGLVFSVSIANAQGQIVASNPAVKAISVASENYYAYHRQHDSGAAYVSRTMRDAANAEYHVHFTRRLNDSGGGFAGIAIVEVDPEYFTIGYERSRQGERGMLALYGQDGIVRALRVGERVSWGQPVPQLAPGDQPVAGPWDAVRRYVRVRPLGGFGLLAAVGVAEDEQMAAFEAHRMQNLWKAGVGTAVLVLTAGLLWLWLWHGAKTRRRIRRQQETYAAASQANLDAFFVLRSVRDRSGRIVDFRIADANPQAEKMTGMRREQLAARSLLSLLPDARDNGILAGLIHITLAGGVHEQEWENTMPQLSVRWVHQQVVGVEDGVVAIVRDISERKQAEARILHMAHHDSLTGLPNRALVADRLGHAITSARRNGNAVMVAFIDLDSFKLVNDGLGHNAGDELLKVVAARMTGCVRANDTVGRFGGDEFVLVLPEVGDSPATMSLLMEKIRLAVIEPIQLAGQEVQVSCSIGVSVFPRDGIDPDALLSNADAAMYRAKDKGKNNYQFYTHEMNASVEEKLALLEGLRNAVEQQQFRVLYQPKVDLHSGAVFGVEALVRWEHPEHGMISPLRFIPLAEESGLIVLIGEWVMRTACRQARAWQDAGLPVTVSVNVSPRQFDDAQLVSQVEDALLDAALDPQYLELEVTESLIMRDMQQAVAKMRVLKNMGVSLSVDDFGTGYSSLSALKSFPISRLKIDRSFVSDLATSADDQAIARAIISLAHQLHLRVIAEGVETEQQQGFLRENGCDEMQGYLFSKPVEASHITAMLLRQGATADSALA
ncbi:MAG TPA: EAL domain-containing protein [Burkholderiaceae bacterium]